MGQTILAAIQTVNSRLKRSGLLVAIELRGDRLNLRATLPPKPRDSRTVPYQQRLPLKMGASLATVKEAEKTAKLIGGQLAAGKFCWSDWGHGEQSERVTCSEAIAQFHTTYLGQGGKEDTWQGDYWKPLKHLPPKAMLTADALEALALATQPNTKSRQRTCMAAGALAKFAGIDWDGKRLRGNYSPKRVGVRDIPDDRLIVGYREGLTNPAWQWVYGMMACYGLRNHEVFHLDLSLFPVVQVMEATKTGAREVWPCYPEWAAEWNLRERRLPPVNVERPNRKVGHSVTKYLSPQLPFSPYDLRHAWAIRTLLFGWPLELSARQMGHSVEVHCKTYQRWINRGQIQKVYDLLINRPDRPLPPSDPV